MVELRAIRGGQAGAAAGSGLPFSSSDPGLLATLYERHGPAVFARCRYLLRDEEAAADALQDVFVRVLRALPELRAAQSPSGWILRVATNHCLNELRGRSAAWRTELVRMAQARPLDSGSIDRRELVRALLLAAPEEARELAVLYYVDELTQEEIAELTGRSRPTVRKRLREFLAAARAALAEAWPGLRLPQGDDL
ncbi:MAG: RNA polymerase sigma factor [Myxococcales bacterium]